MSKNLWFQYTNPVIYEEQFIQLTAFHKMTGEAIIIQVQNESDFTSFVRSHRYDYNIFYSVGLTDGNGRKEKNIIGANFIVLDFDFKEHAKKPINRLAEELKEILNLYYYQIVDSGHGYHVYIAIEHTNDVERWNNVTKELARIYGADEKAALKTQIIRAPGSLNWKDPNTPLSVNVLYSKPSNRYTLSALEQKIEELKRPMRFGKHVDNKPCIDNMLKGVSCGDRNFALGRLIYHFKLNGFPKEHIYNILDNWNKNKNEVPKKQSEFKGEFETYWASEMPMGCCHVSNPFFQEKLNKYCDPQCPLKGKVVIRKAEHTKMAVPATYFEPTAVRNLNGKELAILCYIYKKRSVTISQLKEVSCICKNVFSAYMKHLMQCGYIRREGNTVYSNAPIDFQKKIEVAEQYVLNAMTKEMSGNEFKVYAMVLWYNSENKKPTLQAVSSSLGLDKSNVSPVVNKLLKKQILYDNSSLNNTAGNIMHRLSA